MLQMLLRMRMWSQWVPSNNKNAKVDQDDSDKVGAEATTGQANVYTHRATDDGSVRTDDQFTAPTIDRAGGRDGRVVDGARLVQRQLEDGLESRACRLGGCGQCSSKER